MLLSSKKIMAALIHGTAKQYYGFTPLSIRNCRIWLDGSDKSVLFQDTEATTPITSSGQAVAAWRDKANGYLFTQATAGNRPTYTEGSGLSPCITFTRALGTFMSGTDSASYNLGTGPVAFFLVHRNLGPSGSTGAAPFGFNAGPNGGVVFQNNSGRLQPFSSGTTAPYTSTNIRVAFFYRPPTAPAAAFLNGVFSTISETLSAVQYGTTLEIGRRPGQAGTDGEISDIIMYNRNITAGERQAVEGYFAWKYGFQSLLPTIHTYSSVSSPPLARALTPPDLFGGSVCLWLDGNDPNTISYSSGTTVSYWRDKVSNLAAGVYTEPFGSVAFTGPTYDASTGALFFNNANNPNKTSGQNGLRLMAPSGNVTSGKNLTISNTTWAIYVVYNTTRSTSGAGTTQNDVVQTRVNQATDAWAYQHHIEVGMGEGPNFVGPFQFNTDINQFTTTTEWSTSNEYNILGTFFTPTSVQIRMNGTQYAATTGTPGITVAPDIQLFTIGAHIDNRIFSGYIREIIVVDNISAADKDTEKIEGYLAWKWSLVGNLPSTHAYKNVPPSTEFPVYFPPVTSNFIIKFNKVYNDPVLRCRQATTTGSGHITYSIVTDRTNNCITTGLYFSTTLTAFNKDDVAFGTTLAANGSGNECGYLIKYTRQGYIYWVTRAISNSASLGIYFKSVAVDLDDNIYVGTITDINSINVIYTFFNNGGTVFGGTLTNNTADAIITITKYTPLGNVSWLSRITGSSASSGRANATVGLVTDSESNLFFGGFFLSESVSVYDSSNTLFSTISNIAAGNRSSFFVKYNSSGTVQHVAKALTTATGTGVPTSVNVDSSNNFFYCGSYAGTMTIFSDPSTTLSFTSPTTGSARHGFIIKYSSTLQFQWFVSIIGGTRTTVNTIVADTLSSGFYACGSFNATTCEFKNTSNTTILTLSGSTIVPEGFLAKYDANGTPLWAIKSETSAGLTEFNTIKIDSFGNIYICGMVDPNTVGDTITFRSKDVSNTYVLSTRSAAVVSFIAIYNNDGQIINVRQISQNSSGNTTNNVTAFDIDQSGNLWMGAYAAATANATYVIY
jgi:hypothetical protein